MTTTTTRLGLEIPAGPDDVNVYPTVSTQQMDILDGAVLYSPPTTLAGMPAASSVPDGTFTRTTDTDQVFFSDGTTWRRVGGRQIHSFTMDDQTSQNASASIMGSFPADPDQGETVTLVEVIVHCVTVGSTPSTFKVQTDHASHGTLANVAGLTALSPTTTMTIVTPSSPLVLASLDRVCVVATNASTGNSLGITIAVVTQHSP